MITREMIFVYIAVFVSVVLTTLALSNRRRRKEDPFNQARRYGRTSVKRNFLIAFTRIFSKSRLTRRRYNRLKNKIQSIYPDETVAVEFRTTKELLRAYIFAAIILAVAVISSRGDAFFLVAGIMLDYLLLDYVTNTRTNAMELRLLVQLRTFVTQVNANYNKCHMVDDAIFMTLATNPEEIGQHAYLIHKALTSVNIRKASDEYVAKAPNNYLMLLMAICSSVQEYGDKRIGSNQEPMFTKNLSYLNEEISKEIENRRDNASRFKFQIVLCLIPAFLIKPLEYWSISNYSSLRTYFEGMYGTLMMAAEFILIFLCYQLISSLKSGKELLIKETSVFQRIAAFPLISRILRAYNRKHYSKSMKINDDLLVTRDRTGVNAFYIKKIILAIGAITVTCALFGTSILREKAHILKDFTEEYTEAFVTSESFREEMRTISEMMAETYRASGISPDLTQEEIRVDIEKNTDIKDPAYSAIMASVIYSKLMAYKNSYFKYYYLAIAYLVGFIAFFIPNFILRFKVSEANKDQVDEVAQFQTLALILMNVDGMTLEQILEWMDRFSFCFKYRIQQCIIDLPQGEAKALRRMKDGPSIQFNQFVDALENIDSVGVVQAFSTIEGDRSYFNTIRQQENREARESRSTIGSLVSLAPLMIVIFCQLVLPMIIMTNQLQSQLNDAMMGGM